MKLLLTGLVNPLLVLALFVLASGLSVYLYRKHALPRPWSWMLPTLRIFALFLIVCCLLQPVLARFGTKRIIGQIPVIVDTSGSMATVDTYEKYRKIEIGWALEFFPKALRNTVFNDEADRWGGLEDTLLALETQAGELKQTPDDEAAIKAFARRAEHISKQLDTIRGRFDKAIEKSDYLKQDEGQKPGSISWERFNNIPGVSVNDLTRAPNFPEKPDERGSFDHFASGRNVGDHYGLRIYGYLLPPVSGKYTFSKHSDDGSELWLSKDDDPSNMKRLIPANQTQASQSLKQGRAYYIQVLFKENSNQDFVRIGWERPDGKTEDPIPGKSLAKYRPDWGPDFYGSYQPFIASLRDLKTSFDGIAEALQPKSTEDRDKPLPVQDQVKRFSNSMETWRSLEHRLEDLQKLADETLHDAKVPEVDAAVERLAELNRLELAKLALDAPPLNILKKLRSKGTVTVFSLHELAEPLEPEAYAALEGHLPATRFGSIINRVMNRYEKQPIAGVVLVGDGGNNAGIPVREMREALDERNISLYPLAIGSEKPPPDVAIAQVVAPQTIFRGDYINLSVTLHRNGHTDKSIRLKLLSGDELLKEERVEPGDLEELVVNISYAETNSGTRVYRIETEVFEGEEAFDHNNTKSFSVNVLEDRILTLCIDEFPRWETRYANMMLKRDKRVDLDTIFVASTKEGELPLGEGKDRYPDSQEALFKYHILVLGDVNPNHFTTAQLEHIRDFVRVRGGTLIAMAGPHHMPSAYAGTPLADILPLNRMGRSGGTNRLAMSFGQDPLAFKEGLYQPVLAQEGSFEDILQVGTDPENTFELWNRLPRLSWLKEDVSTARSADPLVHAEAHKGESVTGQAPVMVKAYAGLGKVLYLGSDSFWRWRYRARWKYHHRFWGQILLWSTTGRTTGSDEYVKLMSERPIYAPEETVMIKARLLDEKEMPLANADATIEIYDEEDQLVKRQPLFYIENSGGEYRAEIRDLDRGSYKISPRVAELDHLNLEAEIQVEVRDLPTSEFVDLALNLQSLKEISTNAVPFEQALPMLDKIEKIDIREEMRSDTELWDSWWYLMLIAGLLATEWMLRKHCKLA